MTSLAKSSNWLDNLLYKAEESPSEGPAQQQGGQFSKPRGGKYIHREWSGDHWEYTYAGDPHPKYHGIQNAHSDVHSLPIAGKVSDETHQQAQAGNQGALKQIYQSSRAEASKPVPGQKAQFEHPETGEPTMAAVTKQGTIDEFRAKKDPQGQILKDPQGNVQWDTAHGRTARAGDWDKFLDKMRQKSRAHTIQGNDGSVQFVIMPSKAGKFNEETNKWEGKDKFKIKIVEGAPGYDLITGTGSGSGERSKGGKPWKELNTKLGRDAAIARANTLKRNSELLQERQGNRSATEGLASGKSASQLLQDGALPLANVKGRQIQHRMANGFQSPQEQQDFMNRLESENQQPIIQAIQSLENRGMPVDYTPGELSSDPNNPVTRAIRYAAEKFDSARSKVSVANYLKSKIAQNAYLENIKRLGPGTIRQGEANDPRIDVSQMAAEGKSDLEDAMAQRIDEGENPEDVSDDTMEEWDNESQIYHNLLSEKLNKVKQVAPNLVPAISVLQKEADKMLHPDYSGLPTEHRAQDYMNRLHMLVNSGHIPKDPQVINNLFIVSPKEIQQGVQNTKKSFFNPINSNIFHKSVSKLYAAACILSDENTVLMKAQPPQLQAQYSHKEGDENHPKFYFTDDKGNYRRYTNAPDQHEDAFKYGGESALHGSEPMMESAPHFFTQDGRKLTRAPHTAAEVQWNPNYHRNDPNNLWAGRWVNPMTGQHEYTYIDADIRNQPKLQINRQIALLDTRLPFFRQYVTALLKSTHIKDRVIGLALALLDQGRFRIRELAGMKVGHVQLKGDHIQMGWRQFHCDSKIQQEIQALVASRYPEEPLFAVPAVKAGGEVDYENIRRIGPHLLINVLDSMGMSFNALQMYHASQCYSIAFQNVLSQNDVSYDAAHHFSMLDVASQLGHNLDNVEDYSTALEYIQQSAVDPVVVDSIRNNCEKLGICRNNNPLTKPVYNAVPFVSSNLTGRTAEEQAFSQFLHLTELHKFAQQVM